jgi:two-component system sensor histidine kinase KdpD
MFSTDAIPAAPVTTPRQRLGLISNPADSGRSAMAWAGGLTSWAMGWTLMLALDGHIDLANLALLLVLSGTLASLWLPALPSLLCGTAAVLAFNWQFVPPLGTFAVDGGQNLLLLGAMALVNAVITGLMARLQTQARLARHHQQQAEQLRSLGDVLRDATEPLAHAGALQATLAALVDAPAALLLCRDSPDSAAPDSPETVMRLGDTDADEAAGLWHCLRQGQAMGPGSGHHDSLAQWYLPLRGRHETLGAAVLRLPAAGRTDEALRSHAQALCDQMGVALQRVAAARAAQHAHEQAQLQGVRNALLAAISHDYRTPLATILGAASSLQDQSERLDAAQRHRLAARIVQETEHLRRLTDNTLQLARLDAPGVSLRLDWESAEEIVGTVLRRARQRAPARTLRARLEPGLPLLRCDAMLLTQLLDNLVENAFNHTPPEAPVEILVRRDGAAVVLAVRDRGPGVALAWRERIFDVFQRGDDSALPVGVGASARPGSSRRGAGVGLAVCRAIAQAHGGELRLRARASGGSSFECRLLAQAPPAGTPPDGLADGLPDAQADVQTDARTEVPPADSPVTDANPPHPATGASA